MPTCCVSTLCDGAHEGGRVLFLHQQRQGEGSVAGRHLKGRVGKEMLSSLHLPPPRRLPARLPAPAFHATL